MKRYNTLLFSLIVLILGLASCTTDELTYTEQQENTLELPKQISAVMPQPQITRTIYSETSSTLKTAWKSGDQISITPVCKYANATLYTVDDSSIQDGAAATFNMTSGGTYNTSNVSTYLWGVYYPGNKIKTDIDFMNFTYDGQVQKASDPMAHLAQYHSMRYIIKEDSYSKFSSKKIDFSSGTQSSCMKFNLSGMTFQSPTKISMSVISSGFISSIFYKNNTLSSYYADNNGSYNGLQTTDELSLNLEGYGSVNTLTGYLMMSNKTVTLPANGYVLIKVTCSDATYYTKIPTGTSDIELTSGYYHSITVTDGWEIAPVIDEANYSFDGEVVTLQQATVGNGIDLVIMGDGFTASDFEGGESSNYVTYMQQAYNDFFSVEPTASFKEYFNVYYVKAVSPQDFGDATILTNGAIGAGTKTKFSVAFTKNSTRVSGNNALVREYAKKALGSNASERIQNATIIVMANLACYAGTCWNSWGSTASNYDYGKACAIGYCSLGKSREGFAQVVHHEIDGHGFGKLADEYSSSTLTSPQNTWIDLDKNHSSGFSRNVDKYVKTGYTTTTYPDLTTTENVLWHDLFNTTNNYESDAVESLGVFEGGYSYKYHFCRPTYTGKESIMNKNTGQFNAISRRQIVYRILSLAGTYSDKKWGTDEELNYFLSWDKEHVLNSTTRAKAVTGNSIEDFTPLAPPEIEEGEWINGYFIPNESK